MNENHANLCPSPEWAAHMHQDVLPQLVVVEIEEAAAEALRERFAGTGLEVVNADASALPFDDDTFDAAGSFTMLHHVPTARLQNQVLAELLRVLRPGSTLIGSDSLHSTSLHDFHVGDVYNPVDPATLLARLQTIGFGAVMVSVDENVTFRARKSGC